MPSKIVEECPDLSISFEETSSGFVVITKIVLASKCLYAIFSVWVATY